MIVGTVLHIFEREYVNTKFLIKPRNYIEWLDAFTLSNIESEMFECFGKHWLVLSVT